MCVCMCVCLCMCLYIYIYIMTSIEVVYLVDEHTRHLAIFMTTVILPIDNDSLTTTKIRKTFVSEKDI